MITQQPNEKEKKRLEGAMWNWVESYVMKRIFEAPHTTAVQLIRKIQLYTLHGADINARNDRGQTLIISLAKICDDEAIELLFYLPNIDIHIQDNYNKTAFAYACEKYAALEKTTHDTQKAKKTLVLLAQHGIDVEEEDAEGNKYLDKITNKLTRTRIRKVAEKFKKTHPQTPLSSSHYVYRKNQGQEP